jgi:hypothetical protein
MARRKTAAAQGKSPRGKLLLTDGGIPLDEYGSPLDPPFLLVDDIVRMNLLGVKTRRVQAMVEQEILPARKASREEEATLHRNGRLKGITVKGVYLIEPAALEYADTHRKPVGYPEGRDRQKRGTKTGAGEARR